jgi:predicted MPP superfamily phosphohydrolase
MAEASMNLEKINRRKFLLTALLATPALLAGDGRFVEPTWVETRRIRLNGGQAGVRFAQFSDVHHKGDRAYLQSVVDKINSLSPDFTCFTGDLMEEAKYLPETLEILSGIKSPLFGVPGNHDYWSRVPFAPIARCFAATGGAWLLDQHRVVADGKINLIGSAGIYPFTVPWPRATGAKNILLMHYPAWAKYLGDRKFDLILAGHSHGGQVRIPLYGPLFLPNKVDEYDRGMFHSPAGPLYVNAGIGYIARYDFRFNCRPEITLFEV